MTILWCGGEDIDFKYCLCSANYSAGYYNADYARLALGGGPAVTPVFSGLTSGWIHRACVIRTSSVVDIMAFLKDPDSKVGLYVRTDTNSGNYNFSLCKYDGSSYTVLARTTTAPFVSGGIMDFSLIDYGTNGTLNFYFKGDLVLTYTGDLTISGVSDFTSGAFFSNSDGSMVFSECIIADEDTRAMRLHTIVPEVSDGGSGWTGGYTGIDESDLNAIYSDSILTITADSEYQCGLSGLPTGGWSIKAVKITALAADGTDNLDIQVGMKIGETVYLGSAETLDKTWKVCSYLANTNPATTKAFKAAAVENLQFACKAVAA